MRKLLDTLLWRQPSVLYRCEIRYRVENELTLGLVILFLLAYDVVLAVALAAVAVLF